MSLQLGTGSDSNRPRADHRGKEGTSECGRRTGRDAPEPVVSGSTWMSAYNIPVFFCAGDKTVVGLLARLSEGDVASRTSSAIFTREKTRCPRVRKMIMKELLRSYALFSSALLIGSLFWASRNC